MYKVEILNRQFAFRSLKRRELRDLQSWYASDCELEDAIVRTCVISYPEDFKYDEEPAGIASQLAQRILDASGMGDGETQIRMLEEARRTVRTPEHSFDLLILSAFPAYKQEDLEDMPPERWFELVAKAERALVEFGRIPPEELVAIVKGQPIESPQPAKVPAMLRSPVPV